MNELTIFENPEFGAIRTVRSKFRFGGTSRHRVISRSQLARQIADLAMYQPE